MFQLYFAYSDILYCVTIKISIDLNLYYCGIIQK